MATNRREDVSSRGDASLGEAATTDAERGSLRLLPIGRFADFVQELHLARRQDFFDLHMPPPEL